MQRQYLEVALQAAIERHDSETALRLIEVLKDAPAGGSFMSRDQLGRNFLQVALVEGTRQVVLRLLDLQDEVRNLELDVAKDNQDANAILLAVRHSHDMVIIMRLLKLAVEAEAGSLRSLTFLTPDKDGKTPLFEVARNKRLDIIQELLRLIMPLENASMHVNRFNNHGTPLHAACRAAEPDAILIATLINAGANVLLPDLEKKTSLDLIARFSFDKIAAILKHVNAEKRAPFIPIYRDELLRNPGMDKTQYLNLTLKTGLKYYLLAMMEFDPQYAHLNVARAMSSLDKGKDEASIVPVKAHQAILDTYDSLRSLKQVKSKRSL